MNQQPLVSVILPTYNRAGYIKKSIESVIEQTYRNFELIIIDDESTDNTPEIIAQYKKKDPRIKIITNQTNLGFVKSLNKAIRQARGIYIARLDDDDFWCDIHKLEKQIKFLENNPDYVLVGGGIIKIDEDGKEIVRILLPEKDEAIRQIMLLSDPFAHVSVVFRKESWESVDGYDEEFDYSQDWDLWMKLGKLGKLYNFQEYFVFSIQGEQNRCNENFRHHLMLNIKIRKKYQKDFPNFWKAYLIGWGSYAFSFFSFQSRLSPVFLKLRCFVLGKDFAQKMTVHKTKTIKVCQVATSDIAIRFLLLNQIKNLQQSGYNVSTVCSYGKWIREIKENGISVKTISMTRRINPFLDMITLLKLIFYFRKKKFDIVHTHNPKPGLLGQLAAKFAGIPIIINTIHGFYFNENSSFLSRKFFILIEKIAAKCSDLIFSVDREDIETAIKENICDSKKIKYLGGWVDMDRFDMSNFSEEFIQHKKKDLGIPSYVKVVGIVARLVQEKGYFDLFDAFSRVLRQFPSAILLVVGPMEPEKRDAFNPDVVHKYGIEKSVIFLGERTDVDELYPLMDIFVLPSYREGIGISILEASAMKRPVVATNIRGCREAIDDEETGLLVPLKNIERLAETIIYLLKNPEKAKEMGKNGRKKIEREFDENLVFDRIKIEYSKLIKEKLR